MTYDGLTPRLSAYLDSSRYAAEFSGMTERDLSEMPMDEYARLTGRSTMGQIAAQAVASPPAPTAVPQPPQADPGVPDAGQSVDIASMDLATYAQFRAANGIGRSQKEGRGIFDSVGSQSQGYRDAVRAQSGRTALNNANVQEAPRLEGRYVRQDERIDTRSAAQRFSTPGNAFQTW